MNMISNCQTVLLYACLGTLGLIASICLFTWVTRNVSLVVARVRRYGLLNSVLALLAVALLAAYGGGKYADDYTVRYRKYDGSGEWAEERF